jgi:hypothetical protein
MRYTPADRWLLTALARVLRQVDPVPAEVLADATAAGLRRACREPRLRNRALDLAWLVPGVTL